MKNGLLFEELKYITYDIFSSIGSIILPAFVYIISQRVYFVNPVSIQGIYVCLFKH
jgi:hypothetical protein